MELKKKLKQLILETYCYNISSLNSLVLPQHDFSVTQAFRHMQRGLAGVYEFSNIVTVIQLPEKSGEKLLEKIGKFYEKFNDVKINPHLNYCVVIGFSVELWSKITGETLKVPNENCFRSVYKNNIQILFQIKARSQELLDRTTEELTSSLNKINLSYNLTKCFTKGENLALGGRFKDGVEIPKDPYTFYLHSLIGYQDTKHIGGTYLMAQKSKFDWANLHLQNETLNLMMGRRNLREGQNQIYSLVYAPNSHIKKSRVKDEFGNPILMARQSKLYTEVQPKRSVTDPENPEEGTFFLGYSNRVQKIQKMIESQLGTKEGPIVDLLISNLTVNLGGLLFVPSATNLGYHLTRKQNTHCTLNELCELNSVNWCKDFPGLKERSSSTYLFYSRNSYLQNMSVYEKPENKEIDIEPPSPRILRLLSRMFSLWADTWYNDRKQQQLKHLSEYLKIYQKEDQVLQTYANVQFDKLSITIRNSLSIYVALGHVLTSNEYGCRGFNKQGLYGASTYHLEPQEILVGGSTNLSMGQGKYIINYLTEEEEKNNWINGINLSADSGVGHVVPHYQEIFTIGLGGLIIKYTKKVEQLSGKRNQLNSEIIELQAHQEIKKELIEVKQNLLKNINTRIDFFKSTEIALLGLRRYFENYRKLALRRISLLSKTQKAEIKNLEQVAQRLQNLQNDPPKTFEQGAQIVLSLFTCLHLTGEPVSIGRLDQLLIRFIPDQKYLTKEKLVKYQDTIDNLFLKIGEKVNLNRNTFQDHQKWGNMAMGGSAGPYPQGASFNQWGQQITVGGTTRDGKPLYNLVTVLCLKAARRLPLNAPTLGLRVRSDTPDAILEEAAKSILSGGAHPILLNDDKIIPGCIKSGKIDIGEEVWNSDKSVEIPYSRWNPHVSLEDARDYTSDGCYQIIYQGKSWFSLAVGGCLLEPLQYLINEGKNLLDAGFRYQHGKRNFFLSTKINSFKTYEEFEQEYFKYFKLIYTKSFTGNLKSFGGVTNVCPAPLLNGFTIDTFGRQLDFYSNGPKYNLYCPQFVGLANWINSMWNIKKLVFDYQQTTLQEVRLALLNNWGENLIEPFVPTTIPEVSKLRLKQKYQVLRDKVWNQDKFGFGEEVSIFGNRLTKRISQITVEIFTKPNIETLKVIKDLTRRFSSQSTTFGLQVMPGCGSFAGYVDNGLNMGPSFDGRKKQDPIAVDYSRQPFLNDIEPINQQPALIEQTLALYQEPDLISGSVLDFNIDQDYPLETLKADLKLFALGQGPSIITITTCNLSNLQACLDKLDYDLIRVRMGGWQQFCAAMFPQLLKPHFRRPRSIYKLTPAIKERLQKLREKKLKKG